MLCSFGKDCNNKIFIYMTKDQPICKQCFENMSKIDLNNFMCKIHS